MNYEERRAEAQADFNACLADELSKIPQPELITDATIALIVPALAQAIRSLPAPQREDLMLAGRKHIHDLLRHGLVRDQLEAPAYGVLDLIGRFAESPIWPPRS
ncbi:MAG: hypothetical protein OXK79_05495 [Chloroflexota bacterium]|nr:hypothetical protein [Chloroflexota bacterium]